MYDPLYKAPYRAMTNAGLCLSNTERKDEAGLIYVAPCDYSQNSLRRYWR